MQPGAASGVAPVPCHGRALDRAARAGQCRRDGVVREPRIRVQAACPSQVQAVAAFHGQRLVPERQVHRQPGALLTEIVHGLTRAGGHDRPQQAAIEQAVARDPEFRLPRVRRGQLAAEIQDLEICRRRQQIVTGNVAHAQPQIEGFTDRREQASRVVRRQRTEARLGPRRRRQFECGDPGHTALGHRNATGSEMAACRIPDRGDAVGTADVADDALRADVHRLRQVEIGDIPVQHRDAVLHPEATDQLRRAPCRGLEHFHRVDVRGARLDTQAGKNGVLAGADIQHDLARHCRRECGAIRRETHGFRIHQAIQPLVVDAVGAEGRPELQCAGSGKGRRHAVARHDPGGEPLVAGSIRAQPDGRVAHAGVIAQRRLDVARFNAVAAEFQLGIHAAQILQRSVRELPDPVTAPVAADDAAARQRDLTEAGHLLRRRQVTGRHALAAHPEFSGRAGRHRPAGGIEHEQLAPGQWLAQVARAFFRGIGIAVDAKTNLPGRLGNGIGVDQAGLVAPREPAGDVIATNRLAAQGEVAQPAARDAGMKTRVVQHAPEGRWRLAEHRDLFLGNQFAERGGILANSLRYDDDAAPVQQRAPHFPH